MLLVLVNKYQSDGLPNITGGAWLRFNGGATIWVSDTYGAISGTGNGACEQQGYGGTTGRPAYFNFNASGSNQIYGRADHIRPRNVGMLPIIKY